MRSALNLVFGKRILSVWILSIYFVSLQSYNQTETKPTKNKIYSTPKSHPDRPRKSDRERLQQVPSTHIRIFYTMYRIRIKKSTTQFIKNFGQFL